MWAQPCGCTCNFCQNEPAKLCNAVTEAGVCARSEKDPKFVYYLSAEFLMGRSLMNAVQNLELTGAVQC